MSDGVRGIAEIDSAKLTAQRRRPWLAAAEGIAIGLFLGLVDIHSAGDGTAIVLAYFVAGLGLGALHGRWALLLSWPPLGGCLYLVHLTAIACGYRQPYVEANADMAVSCLCVLEPSSLGVVTGAILRWGVRRLVKLGL